MDHLKVHLIPHMDNKNRICGTQFIYGGRESTRVYIIDGKKEDSVNSLSKTPFVSNEGYKIYKNSTYGEHTAVLAYSKLSPEIMADTVLSKYEKANILEDSIKALLNSVIFDPSIPIPYQLGSAEFDPTFMKAIDLGRGMEILEWFSLVSLKCDSDDLSEILDKAKRKYDDNKYDAERFSNPIQLSFCSLMERVLVRDLVNNTGKNLYVVANGQCRDYDRVRSLQQD